MSKAGTSLVTGGAKRIGKSIAIALARKGYHIALHYNHSLDDAQQVKEHIEINGGNCSLFSCDFANIPEVLDLIHRVTASCPDLNVLINNASIFEKASLIDTEEDFFDRHFTINFKTPFFLMRDFARTVKRGHIINILDTKVMRTVPEYFAYTLTKKNLHDCTKLAAKQLAPQIRVNGIGPGLILPPPGEDESYLEKMKDQIPLQQYGNPEQIVEALIFLLDNPFITGHCILVDGGEHLK